jgi:hypothetical protein
MEKINTTYIKRELWYMFSNYKYQLFNVFVFNNESDFLAVSRSNYTIEVEIKTSRADFKNDFKKTTGFRNYGKNKHEHLQSDNTYKPNKFCFAVPEGMITQDEVPKYAGLIYIAKTKDPYYVKYPKFLHKHNLLQDNKFLVQILNKYYYQNMNLRRVLNAREWEIKYRQCRIEYE